MTETSQTPIPTLDALDSRLFPEVIKHCNRSSTGNRSFPHTFLPRNPGTSFYPTIRQNFGGRGGGEGKRRRFALEEKHCEADTELFGMLLSEKKNDFE